MPFFNIINNTFKPGPVTPGNHLVRFHILKPEAHRANPPVDGFGLAYVSGNRLAGNPCVTADNWDGGVQPEPVGNPASVLDAIRAVRPYPHAYLELESAEESYEQVLGNAGATLPCRDRVDQRIIEMVRTGKVTARPTPEAAQHLEGVGFSPGLISKIIGEVALGIITDPDQVGGYPLYRGEPYPDGDNDRLPDAWETRYGLNPVNPNDANGALNNDGYTNIEGFINGQDPDAPPHRFSPPDTYRNLWKSDPDLASRLKS